MINFTLPPLFYFFLVSSQSEPSTQNHQNSILGISNPKALARHDKMAATVAKANLDNNGDVIMTAGKRPLKNGRTDVPLPGLEELRHAPAEAGNLIDIDTDSEPEPAGRKSPALKTISYAQAVRGSKLMSGARKGTPYLDLTNEYPEIDALIKDKRPKVNGLSSLVKRATALRTQVESVEDSK